jgi:hypothetical protein
MFRSSGAIARPFRSRWFSGDVNLVIDKGVLDIDKGALDISRVRQREMLPRPLGQLAARSGQVLNTAAISGTIGLENSTTENFIKAPASVLPLETSAPLLTDQCGCDTFAGPDISNVSASRIPSLPCTSNPE